MANEEEGVWTLMTDGAEDMINQKLTTAVI
jgi:hypothetical protein